MTNNPLLGQPKFRVNGSMLSQYKGKGVCLLGHIVDPEPTGMSFKLQASDGVIVMIQLQEPIQDCIQGIVEVHGIAKNEKLVHCHNYVPFPPEYIQKFDMTQYNEMVVLINERSDLHVAEFEQQ